MNHTLVQRLDEDLSYIYRLERNYRVVQQAFPYLSTATQSAIEVLQACRIYLHDANLFDQNINVYELAAILEQTGMPPEACQLAEQSIECYLKLEEAIDTYFLESLEIRIIASEVSRLTQIR